MWYVLTDKRVLVKKNRITMIQIKDHTKLNRKEAPSLDDLLSFIWGNKIIIRGQGREGS